MKRLLGGLFMLILAGAIAQAQGNKIEQAVLSLEQQWENALVKADAAALDKLYSDKLIYTHSNASLDDKTSYIAKIKSGASKYVSIKRDDIKVTVIGNTAIVTCHWLVQGLSGGKTTNTDARYIHVYVKEKGGWKMAAHQSTYVVK